MAYPTVSAPYGFKPINRFDGMPYAGATMLMAVTSGQAVYTGQVVKQVAGGTISPVADLNNESLYAVGVVTGVQYTAVGENATLVNNTGITTAGNSQVAILDSTATTDTLPIRIVDVVPDTAYVSGGNTLYPEVIVKLNFGMHAYETAVGV